MGGRKEFLLIFGMYRPATPFSLSVGILVRSHLQFPPLSRSPAKNARSKNMVEIVRHSLGRPLHSTLFPYTSALYRTCLAPEHCVRTRSKEIPQSDICTLLTHPRKSPFQSKAAQPFSGLIRVVTRSEQFLDHLAPLTFPYTALQNMIRTCER